MNWNNFIFQSTMWIRKSIILLALVSLLSALPKSAPSKCPDKCNCEANGNIVRCPENTTLKDWLRIGSTISKNATKLEITFADFTCLSLSTFKKLPNLSTLRIWEGRLTKFPRGLSRRFPRLKLLFISRNQISDIPRSAIKDLKWLESFLIPQNLVTEVPANTFKGMTRLGVINLNDNKIKFLHRDSFNGLKNLFFVSLSKNKLVDLPKGLFSPRPVRQSEMYFLFDENKIQEIKKDLFVGATDKLKLLGLIKNQITKIEQGAFDSLKAVSGNNGKIVICGNPIIDNVCAMSLLDFSNVKLNVKTRCPTPTKKM